MATSFVGRWRGTVISRKAGYGHRVVVSGAAAGNGTYDAVVGRSFEFTDGSARLEWNNGAGWAESSVVHDVGLASPVVWTCDLSADDGYLPGGGDGDYADLKVSFEYIDPLFAVDVRPFALERGSRVMLPDGIFDTSQGVQYMGVRIRNTWFVPWNPQDPSGDLMSGVPGVEIGIAPESRAALAARGIVVRDDWLPAEAEAFGQEMNAGYVRMPTLAVGETTTIYFKIDVSQAGPSKPQIGFVARRSKHDPKYDAPTRVAQKQIFVSRSTYDSARKELVCEVPEGRLRLKFTSIVLDQKAANAAAKDLLACLERSHSGTGSLPKTGGSRLKYGWQQGSLSKDECRVRGSAELRDLFADLQDGKDVDVCRLQRVLEACCCSSSPCGCNGGPGAGSDGGGTGGWGDGTGVDGWCRVKPVAWLPISFKYRIEPATSFSGQYGPLAFQDPWWKVVLILVAVLLEIASLIHDYVRAGQDPEFIIGKILRNGDAMTNAIDCAVSDLNRSRSVDRGVQDAQSDDSNNASPIEGLGGIISLDRTDNGNFGVQAATMGNTVWKSGGRTGTTRGTVTSITYSSAPPFDDHDTISGTVTFTNQVLVTQITGMTQPLSQGGDSGSVWVDMASKRPIALNFAGPADDSGTYGVGNPILDVVNRLNIRFNPIPF
ncbi:hypothetical protein P1P75_03660 [Streptomyces sp. ID05-39B]|uniref:hypothetical protein n=1 Tax=Streptomyces sp. ID05-39B TaxID=3028664 RepID=UPI0029A19534|nr:hypothetical protein [Streptomyces sp. ID05-39B]MDX3525550.1 hypothetical protein [Streptomyces sp. ID05-39B]